MHSDESGRSHQISINHSDPGSTAHHNSGSSRAQRITSVNVPVSHLNALKQLLETCYVQHPITSDILQHPTTSWLHNSLKQDSFLDAGIIVPNRDDHPTHPVHQSPLWTEVPEHQPVTHDGFHLARGAILFSLDSAGLCGKE